MTATADMKEAVAAFFGRIQSSEKNHLSENDALAEVCHTSLHHLIDEIAATLPPLPPAIETESIPQQSKRAKRDGAAQPPQAPKAEVAPPPQPQPSASNPRMEKRAQAKACPAPIPKRTRGSRATEPIVQKAEPQPSPVAAPPKPEPVLIASPLAAAAPDPVVVSVPEPEAPVSVPEPVAPALADEAPALPPPPPQGGKRTLAGTKAMAPMSAMETSSAPSGGDSKRGGRATRGRGGKAEVAKTELTKAASKAKASAVELEPELAAEQPDQRMAPLVSTVEVIQPTDEVVEVVETAVAAPPSTTSPAPEPPSTAVLQAEVAVVEPASESAPAPSPRGRGRNAKATAKPAKAAPSKGKKATAAAKAAVTEPVQPDEFEAQVAPNITAEPISNEVVVIVASPSMPAPSSAPVETEKVHVPSPPRNGDDVPAEDDSAVVTEHPPSGLTAPSEAIMLKSGRKQPSRSPLSRSPLPAAPLAQSPSPLVTTVEGTEQQVSTLSVPQPHVCEPAASTEHPDQVEESTEEAAVYVPVTSTSCSADPVAASISPAVIPPAIAHAEVAVTESAATAVALSSEAAIAVADSSPATAPVAPAASSPPLPAEPSAADPTPRRSSRKAVAVAAAAAAVLGTTSALKGSSPLPASPMPQSQPGRTSGVTTGGRARSTRMASRSPLPAAPVFGQTPLPAAAAATAGFITPAAEAGAASGSSPSPFAGMPTCTPHPWTHLNPGAGPPRAGPAAVAFSPAPAWPSTGGGAAVMRSAAPAPMGGFAFPVIPAGAAGQAVADLSSSTPLSTLSTPSAVRDDPKASIAAPSHVGCVMSSGTTPVVSVSGFGSPQEAEIGVQEVTVPPPQAAATAAAVVSLPSLAASPLALPEAAPCPSVVAPAPLPAATSSAVPAAAATVGAPSGSNVVAAIRSFLPAKRAASPQIAAGGKKVKVRALEAALAVKKADEVKAVERARAREDKAAPQVKGGPVSEPASGPASELPGGAPATGSTDTTVAAGQVKLKAAAFQQRIQQEEEAKRLAKPPGGTAALPLPPPSAVGTIRSGAGPLLPAVGADKAAKRVDPSGPPIPQAQVAQRPDVNDKLKRAEQRRKEEEERRRTELEAKQRLKDDRAKAVKLQQAAGGGAPAAAKTEAVVKAAPPPAKEALPPAVAAAAPPPPPLQAKSTNVPPAASSTAAGLVKKGTAVTATAPFPPPQQQPTPGFAVMGLAVSSSAAKAGGSQNNAPTPKLLRAPAAVSQYPPLTPAELAQEAVNIKKLVSSPYINPGLHRTPGGTGAAAAAAAVGKSQQFLSYEISPYRSDNEEDDDMGHNSRKPIPEWAQPAGLAAALQRQLRTDPDRVFEGKIKTCVLEEVFEGMPPAPIPSDPVKASKRRDWRKRGSSGNWIADRLTWQEEMVYKKTMGYPMR